VQCGYGAERALRDGAECADPAVCDYCNP
jgi:hypothetical protein